MAIDLERTKREALRSGLHDLFRKKRHFCICHFDNLCEMTGCSASGEVYRVLKTQHCVDYSDMTPKLRADIFELVVSTFAQEPTFNLDQVDSALGIEPPAEQAIKFGFFRKLGLKPPG